VLYHISDNLLTALRIIPHVHCVQNAQSVVLLDMKAVILFRNISNYEFLIIKNCTPFSYFPTLSQIFSLAPCCQASQYIFCEISFTSIKITHKIIYGLLYFSYFWTGDELRITILQENLSILCKTCVKYCPQTRQK